MATSTQVREFRSNNADLVALAHRDLIDFWSALDVEGNPLRVKDALLDFFPELVAAYGDAASLLAADFYDATRNAPPSSSRFAAILSQPVDSAQAEASARWGLGPLFQEIPAPSEALTHLLGSVQRLVLQPGRSTQIESAISDPVRTGFARVPVGVTCRFCTMLAARGFVYASERAAGQSNRWHDHCDCVIVSGQSIDDLPDDYDIDEYRRLYANGSGVLAS